MTDKNERAVDKEIELAASPEAVWKCLTDAEELTRWFPLEARVTPGVGGAIVLSWGPGFEASACIDVWDEGRHLRAVTDAGTLQLAVDYFIEARGGKTVLRIVHSGFGSDADWDDEIQPIDRGWGWFLKQLRHYLERHAGTPRRAIRARKQAETSAEDAWRRLLGPGGMRLEGTPQAGARYQLTTAGGDPFIGVVLGWVPPFHFAATVENLDDALVLVEVEPARGGRVVPSVLVSTYGVDEATVAGLRGRLQQLVDDLFRDDPTGDDSTRWQSMTPKEPS